MNQDPPFFVIAEGARLLGPFPHRDAAEQIAIELSCEGTESAVMSAAELATLRDRAAQPSTPRTTSLAPTRTTRPF